MSLQVDDQRIWLPAEVDPSTTYDVLLNRQHVWSLQPGRDAAGTDGRGAGLSVSWPKALRRYLSGRAEVALRDHVTGRLVASTEHVFAGDRSRRVAVVDAGGRALVLDKWGRLIRPLSVEGDAHLGELMSQVHRLLEVLREDCGVPAYVVYGTLLGAVRDGRLIGYDNDIDLAYVSDHSCPVDVMREGFGVQRILHDRGWVVRRGSGARINVRLPMSDGSMRFVDVFTSMWVGQTFYIPSDVGARLPREAILPLGTVELMGQRVPAPADPAALLAATYGDGWRHPDPSFRYSTPRWLSRRLNGWFGGLMKSRKHWDSFYAKEGSRVPAEPSPFARWVGQTYPSDRPLVDVGAGTGRDAVWFAAGGRKVIAVDYSMGAVNRTRRLARARGVPVESAPVNLYDTRAVLALGARLAREQVPADVYLRFTLHALGDEGRENVWRLASMALRRGGLLYAEFRTPRDSVSPHVFGKHFRRYLRPADVVAEVAATGGRVVHREQGRGLARFESENPHVCRVVASWSHETGLESPHGRRARPESH